MGVARAYGVEEGEVVCGVEGPPTVLDHRHHTLGLYFVLFFVFLKSRVYIFLPLIHLLFGQKCGKARMTLDSWHQEDLAAFATHNDQLSCTYTSPPP